MEYQSSLKTGGRELHKQRETDKERIVAAMAFKALEGTPLDNKRKAAEALGREL